MGQWLSERLGQSFIIENRPGASSNIATEAVVRALPDGYTLLLVTAANAINTSLYEKLSFNLSRDIAPVAGITPMRIIRSASRPLDSLDKQTSCLRRCDMRVAVMAAGAVGGYFGGRMAADGHDVVFIARGAHGDAVRRDGLKIESALGDLHLKNVNVTDDPKQVGPVDVVLFAVKLWDTETAGEQTRALVGPNTRVITLQNGVDSVERLAPILGDEATIAGTTYVVTNIARPGVIRHTGTVAKIHCGRLDGRPDAVLEGYVEQMKAAGIDITATGDMLLEIWKKFVLLSGTSGITASTRQPLGVIRDDADMRTFFFRLMHETMAVGRAAGVEFPPDFPAELERSVAGFPPMMKASMANDLHAGNRLELDWLAGKVVALGRKYGIPTPTQEAVYAILKPYRMGR